MTSTEWVKGSRLVKVMDDWAEHLHLGLHRTSRRCLFLQGSVMGRRWRVKEKSGVWLTFFSFLAHCFVGCPASFTCFVLLAVQHLLLICFLDTVCIPQLFCTSQAALVVKNSLPMQETQEMQVRSWVRKIPWRRAWQPTPVSLPGETHGQRSLAGYSPWGRRESDMTEAAEHTCTPIFTFLKCTIEWSLIFSQECVTITAWSDLLS